MRPRISVVVLFVSLAARGAHADDHAFTSIDRGVWQIDLGAIGVFSSDSASGMSATRLSTDLTAALSYYVVNNVSVGVQGLLAYDDAGDGATALTYGGAVAAAVSLRLGLGAFFRPGIALGGLFGHRDLPIAGGTFQSAAQTSFIARLQLPIVFFASTRILLEAGPELDVTIGSYGLPDGTSQSFSRTAGGFAVGVGYIF